MLINAGDEGGNDDVQGPGPEAAPDQRLWGDQAAIKLLAGEIIEVIDRKAPDFNGDRSTMVYQGNDPDMRGPFPGGLSGEFKIIPA